MYVANKEGCSYCSRGYRGRLAILEVLIVTEEIKDAITNNLPKSELRELVYKGDVVTQLQDGLNKVLLGETTFEEILKIVDLEDDFNSYKENNLRTNLLMAQKVNLNKINEEKEAKLKEIEKNKNLESKPEVKEEVKVIEEKKIEAKPSIDVENTKNEESKEMKEEIKPIIKEEHKTEDEKEEIKPMLEEKTTDKEEDTSFDFNNSLSPFDIKPNPIPNKLNSFDDLNVSNLNNETKKEVRETIAPTIPSLSDTTTTSSSPIGFESINF